MFEPPGQAPATKEPEQELLVNWQFPDPLEVEHGITQH